MPEDLATEFESMPELLSTSESEQMYLITVARAEESGIEGPVSISKIAGALGVSVPSANEMVRKLDGRGLLVYEPYRGVLLSASGRDIADQVLRTRRLWATFLVEHLGFSPHDADDQACHLEHATSAEAANRLSAFLGNPVSGPLGRPIPQSERSVPRRPIIHLTDATVGATVEVISVVASGRIADYLTAEGIKAGSLISVAASGSTGLLVDLAGKSVHISASVAGAIEVRRPGGAHASA